MSYKSDLLDISVVLVHETDKAVLVDHGAEKPTWLPKSVIEIERNADGKTHTITLPESWAKEKGII